MLKKFMFPVLGGLIAASIFATSASADQILTMRSGLDGNADNRDDAISMLIGPADLAFPNAFTAMDFASARSGSAAFLVTPNASWLSPASFSDSSARWISTNATGNVFGNTALFAIDFFITDAVIAAAEIVFNVAVDNSIGGGGPNLGLFLNGNELPDSGRAGFAGENVVNRTDIAPFLVSGLNTLYINMTDAGGPSGLLFSTTITTVAGDEVALPEPGMIAIFGLGLIGLGLARRGRAF